jgi:hypothetical protein
MGVVAPGLDRQQAINTAVGDLDRWLDTMRGPRGYTGPSADWWRQGFTWTGTALDWRYEGIIAGYLALWRRTGNGHWLAKAQWAGDDLLAGQSPSGHFSYGPAKLGSYLEGAPHGAACAAALLELALVLLETHSEAWQPYATAAELTIHGALLGELWDPDHQVFRDRAGTDMFLPDQSAAVCEALFRHAELRKNTGLIEAYALPALRAIVARQVRADEPLAGAIPYRVSGPRQPAQYLPICVARCIPALVQGYTWTHEERFLEAAWRAFAFIQRWRNDDGSAPAVVYPGGRSNQYPHWIAATGDILHAATILRQHGISTDTCATLSWLLDGQDASGGIATAQGLGAQALQRLQRLPDVRDLRHIPAWCDKAFRALANLATAVTPSDRPLNSEHPCVFRGRRLSICEDETIVEIRHDREVRYRWRKSDDWPTISASEFVLE